jgi:hypothetical protein
MQNVFFVHHRAIATKSSAPLIAASSVMTPWCSPTVSKKLQHPSPENLKKPSFNGFEARIPGF